MPMKRRPREIAKEVIEEVNKLESLKKIDFIIGAKKNKINRILYHTLHVLFYVALNFCL